MKNISKYSIFLITVLTCCNSNFLDLKSVTQVELSTGQTKSTTKTENVVSRLKDSISSQNSYFYILFLSFLAGVFISFTPCVYPMIPITVGILQTQATASVIHNFLSSLLYVLGLAIVYAFLGAVSASTAIIFGQWTANPIFILFIILLFLYLAFSLFGFYEIKIPQFLTKTRDAQIQGPQAQNSLVQSFLLGFFSGAIASPCITPALAILLTLVADTGNPVLGFFSLFFFAFGMGTLLIIIGTISSALNALPKSGEWMLEIKKILGFMMIAMCIYFLRPLISANTYHMLYLFLLVAVLVFYITNILNGNYKNRSW